MGWGRRKRKENSNPFPFQLCPSNSKFIVLRKKGKENPRMTKDKVRKNNDEEHVLNFLVYCWNQITYILR